MTERRATRQTKWGTVFEPGRGHHSPPGRAVVTGFGYTGERLVEALLGQSVDVTVLVRSAHAASRAEAAGASAHVVDLDAPIAERVMCKTDSVLFHLVPPPGDGDQDTRLRRLLAHLESAPPGRIVLVSTTGVYGDHDGDSVDESAAIAPSTDRARRRADAESAAGDFARRTRTELVIMRVAGIYGPQRLPLERLEKRAPLPPTENCGLTNRIHVDDLVTSLLAAARGARHADVFNVADGCAMPMRTWFETVARLAGLPPPPVITMRQARDQLSPGLLSYLNESRHVDNRALIEGLGVRLRYANPEDGIRHALDASR